MVLRKNQLHWHQCCILASCDLFLFANIFVQTYWTQNAHARANKNLYNRLAYSCVLSIGNSSFVCRKLKRFRTSNQHIYCKIYVNKARLTYRISHKHTSMVSITSRMLRSSQKRTHVGIHLFYKCTSKYCTRMYSVLFPSCRDDIKTEDTFAGTHTENGIKCTCLLSVGTWTTQYSHADSPPPNAHIHTHAVQRCYKK